jgi:hypothetical protein
MLNRDAETAHDRPVNPSTGCAVGEVVPTRSRATSEGLSGDPHRLRLIEPTTQYDS